MKKPEIRFEIKCFEGETPGLAIRIEEYESRGKKEMLVFSEFIQFEAWSCSKEGKDIYMNFVQPVRSDMRVEFPIAEYKNIQRVFGHIIEYVESISWAIEAADGQEDVVGVIYGLDLLAEKLREKFPKYKFTDNRKEHIAGVIASHKETEKWVDEHMESLLGTVSKQKKEKKKKVKEGNK